MLVHLRARFLFKRKSTDDQLVENHADAPDVSSLTHLKVLVLQITRDLLRGHVAHLVEVNRCTCLAGLLNWALILNGAFESQVDVEGAVLFYFSVGNHFLLFAQLALLTEID